MVFRAATKFASPTTNQVYPRSIQEQLKSEAIRRGVHASVSRYWVTASQACRLCGTYVMPGETPFTVVNGSSEVIPLEKCDSNARRALLETYPPYFGLGVGIFTDGKWRCVTKPSVVNRLNKEGRERALFVDSDTAFDYGLSKDAKSAVKLSDVNTIGLYHAQQLQHPERCCPPRGIAINPGTGRRWPQPAHDVLLTASLLLGHVSPMWLTLAQAEKLYQVEIRRPNRIVKMHLRDGVAVPLEKLPPGLRAAFRRRAPIDAKQVRVSPGAIYLYDMGNWERVVQTKLLKGLSEQGFAFWVTTRELRRLGFGEAASQAKMLTKFDRGGVKLSHLTKESFINAEDTSDPYIIQPRDRTFILVNGRFVSQTFSDQLLKIAAAREYISPVWLTLPDCVRIGVGIAKGEKPTLLSVGGGTEEFLYNAEDVKGFESWLEEHPPLDHSKHQLFLVTWRPIVAAGKISTLNSFKRELKLWISSTELIISGLELKPGAKRYRVLSGQIGRRRQIESDTVPRGRLVYNAEQTTDPVRATTMATFLIRGKLQ